MSAGWWAFNKDQYKAAIQDYLARKRAEGKDPDSIDVALSVEAVFEDFLNSPEAKKHKMIGL